MTIKEVEKNIKDLKEMAIKFAGDTANLFYIKLDLKRFQDMLKALLTQSSINKQITQFN